MYCIDAQGRKESLYDDFSPFFYVYHPQKKYDPIRRFFDREHIEIETEYVTRRDITEHKDIPVLKVSVHNPARFRELTFSLLTSYKQYTYFNIDIPVEQQYFYTQGLFPMAKCDIEYNKKRRIKTITLKSGIWDMDFDLPPFNTMELSLNGQLNDPKHGRQGILTITINGEDVSYITDEQDEAYIIEGINHYLKREDIDIVTTRWGDSFLIPQLMDLSHKYDIPVDWNRIQAPPLVRKEMRSYFQYGKIVYQPASYFFLGRWHIDMRNSFLFTESGMDGLFEIARITQTPMQQSTRSTIGTCLSSMQLATAYRENILIPYRKHIPEEPKTALELLNADKGGLVYQPLTGFWENVGEVDFASMYPTIMVNFNISPETINCPCCSTAPRVPEIGYRICRKKGLIPKTLAPMLEKRLVYKRLQKESADAATRQMAKGRQSAMKWLLVTCFGYLGYKNARFGRIEAHESVTAFGREILLTAKEVAENRGFRMLNANVDSIYIHKSGAQDTDFKNIAAEIEHITHMPLALEGVYKWIGFLPSKRNMHMSVQNRYFGAFGNGETKVRGIEIRRHDTPAFINDFQKKVIALMAQADTLQEIQLRLPNIMIILEETLRQLEEGEIPLKDLAVRKHLSKAPGEYYTPTWTAIVSQELLSRGIELHPGEGVEMILTDLSSPIPSQRVRSLAQFDHAFHSPDIEKYTQMLVDACDSLLSCFGLQKKILLEVFKQEALPKPEQRSLALEPEKTIAEKVLCYNNQRLLH